MPEVLTFFNRELQEIMNYTTGSFWQTSELFRFEWYSSVVFEFDIAESNSTNLNVLGGTNFRIGAFRIPVFATTVTGIIDKNNYYNSYLGFFGGGGLIYDNYYFSVGSFAGYYDTREYAKYDEEKLSDAKQGSFSFTIIPVLNTGELFYLNILRNILLKLNATQLGINDIALNFRFMPFSLFGSRINSSLFFIRESYSSIARNNIYGAKFSASRTKENLYNDFIWELSLEGGYRNFFDIRYQQYNNHENYFFIKTGIDLIWRGQDNAGGLKFNIMFDKQNKLYSGVYLLYRLDGKHPFNFITGGELGKFAGISFKLFQEISSITD